MIKIDVAGRFAKKTNGVKSEPKSTNINNYNMSGFRLYLRQTSMDLLLVLLIGLIVFIKE